MYFLGIKLALHHLSQKKLLRTFMLISLSSLLLVCGYLAIVYNSISVALQYIGQQQTATVFVDRAVAEEQITALLTAIKKVPGVTEAQYTSRSEFLKKYRQFLPANNLIQESGSEDVVPRYVAAKMKINQATSAETAIKKISGVESVVVSTVRYENLLKALGGLRGIIAVLLTAVAIALAALVVNHYKATTKGAEQLKQAFLGLGARRSHIVVPFLVEGALEGAAAGFIASVLFVVTGHLFQSHINEMSRAMGFLPAQYQLLPMALALFGGGLLIGTMGSLWLSTKKQ
jgi:cell division transport system permease protein